MKYYVILMFVLSLFSACSEEGPGLFSSEVKLTASDGAEDDNFGIAVSISGEYAIVGADNDDNGHWSGSAYIFHFDGTSWVEQQKLLPYDGVTDDLFGRSVSIDGNYVIVGSY